MINKLQSIFSIIQDRFSTYFTLSFTYTFYQRDVITKFAYGIPYTFTDLNKFLTTLKNVDYMPPLRTLSGLSNPILRITDLTLDDSHRNVAFISARIHPGESNSSYVV